MKQFLFAVLFCSNLLCHGQSLISTQGNVLSSNNVQVDFSIGETMIQTYTNQHHTVTQGFHQPQAKTTSLEQAISQAAEVQAFPNPTNGELMISSKLEPLEKIRLYDAKGQTLLNLSFISTTYATFNISGYPSGIYFLRVITQQKNTQLLTIIKE